jgi:hypothetical protein
MPDTSRITVSSVAMRDNIGTLADFPPVLARLGIKSYVVQGLNDYTNYSKDQRLLGADDLRSHFSRLRSACAEWGVDLLLTTAERGTESVPARAGHDPTGCPFMKTRARGSRVSWPGRRSRRLSAFAAGRGVAWSR